MATGSDGVLGVAVADPVLPVVTDMIRTALADYGEWTGAIAPDARLDADLQMQSVEFAILQSRLAARWGSNGDLTDLVRGLDLAGLAALSVADVAAEVRRRLGAAGVAP